MRPGADGGFALSGRRAGRAPRRARVVHRLGVRLPPFCGPDDFNDQVEFGVYNFGGSSSSLSQRAGSDVMQNEFSDGMVMLSGTIDTGDPQRVNMPPDVVTFALEELEGAEIHAAIAPHGQLDVTKLPDDMYNPMGSPGCECWWVGIFMPPG